MRTYCCYVLCFGTLGLLAWVGSGSAMVSSAGAAAPEADPAPQAVEDDMHEFMEYVFQPTYRRLKAAMAAEPANNQGWKAIKSDGLILAEAGNLLLLRTPKDDDTGAWNNTSVGVRQLGGKLYQAAKKKDYPAARQHYTAMLQQCNSCHQKFAGGEHQLTP